MMRDIAIEQHDQLMFWRPEETVVLTCVEKKNMKLIVQFADVQLE